MADENNISVFTLGHTGVVLDLNSLEPTVPLDALSKAQNFNQDINGHGGALRKRPGLAQFNTTYAGGVILGGIPMPVAGFGGAPSAGGGALIGTGDVTDGTSIGTGDMTGAPGATFTGTAAAAAPAGAALFNGGSSIFSGARLVVVGRLGTDTTVSQEGGSGWYVSSKNFADVATSLTSPGPPVSPYSYPPIGPFSDAWGTPSCVLNGYVYYAGQHGNQLTTTSSVIRKTNGAVDSLVATVPVSSQSIAFAEVIPSSKRQAIASMHAGSDNNIYVGVKDKFSGQDFAGSAGRVFKLDPALGTLTEINSGPTTSSTPAAYAAIPYSLCYFDGHLYWGEFNSGTINQLSVIYAANADLTYSTADRSPSADNASMIGSMCVYDGQLFVGTGCYQNTNGGASFLAQLYNRHPGGALGDVANWNSLSFDAARTGNNTNGNYYCSMVVFNSALYAVWYAPAAGTQIYKIVNNNPGVTTSNSFTITSVFSASNYPFYLFVDDSVLYAVGVIDGSFLTAAYSTTDGTSWTNRSGSFGTLGNSSRMRPIFFGVNQ